MRQRSEQNGRNLDRGTQATWAPQRGQLTYRTGSLNGRPSRAALGILSLGPPGGLTGCRT